MEKIKRKLRQFHNKNRGFTLVEMIVSFMLVGLFMVAASKVIINTANVYYEAKGTANGMQICSILTAKIRSEVEGARTDKLTKAETDADGKTNVQTLSYAMLLAYDSSVPDLKENCNGIKLTDATGSLVYIGVNKSGYLDIYYYPTGKSKTGVHWTFDKNTYMGYTVTDLSFSIPSSDTYNSNVICVELTVTSPRYGDFTTTEYIECYNFEKTTNLISTQP